MRRQGFDTARRAYCAGSLSGSRLELSSKASPSQARKQVRHAPGAGFVGATANQIKGETQMILGMSISMFTSVHVILSLVGIASGVVVLAGMLKSKKQDGWTGIFLVTTILTSATGFFFPADKILPSHVVGVVSLIVLAVALLALYRHRLARAWRWIYVAAAVAALYLNVFVGVVQAFLKVPFLHALAPTQEDPAFVIAQLVVLGAFVALGVLALRSFHPAPADLRPA
jgi:hypothetical protein